MIFPNKMLIDGALVDGEATMPVINPANEQVLAAAPLASANQLEAAVQAAAKAFADWSARPIEDRRRIIVAIADAVSDQADELARIVVSEQGMPLWEAQRELGGFLHLMRGVCELDLGPKIVEENAMRRVEEHRRPLGPVAIIVPWNHPALSIAVKLGPALLAGNTVVIKPAPSTPLTALALARIIAPLVPPGVVNIIIDKDDLGPLLTSHPAIRKVTFTGSTATGRAIMSSGASSLKRLTLELGGNDPAIVFADVDIEDVAEKLFHASFRNSGQGCTATKRIYVEAAIYDRFCDELERHVALAKVGDGFSKDVEFGPLQNRRQFERVIQLIDDSRRRGARVFGGEIISPGFFIRPAVVRDLSDGTPIVDEEQFGPVVPVISFTNAQDVISTINAGEFGLGASVWSADPKRARMVAEQIEAGCVTINKTNQPGVHIPFAGAKASGIGVENGLEGLHSFTQLQVIDITLEA